MKILRRFLAAWTGPIPDPETLCRNVYCDHPRADHWWFGGVSYKCTSAMCDCLKYKPPGEGI
jgi:hypothetical protein